MDRKVVKRFKEKFPPTRLEGGEVIYGVHSAADCTGRVCCIHNRSDHQMRDFPQHWRGDRQIMERICPCGVGHPDPDDYSIQTGNDEGVHGCCGCCVNESKVVTING